MNYRYKCKENYKILEENLGDYFIKCRNWGNFLKQFKGLRSYKRKIINRFAYVEMNIMCMKEYIQNLMIQGKLIENVYNVYDKT